MTFEETLENRKSIRSYKTDPVPEEAVRKIANAVQLAPTACNKQPFKVFFIKDPALKHKIAAAADLFTGWLDKAPVIAVVAGNSNECWTRFEGTSIIDVDCAIVMEHLVLAATAEGLGTCWICAFERKKINDILNLNGGWSAVALTPVGYAAENPARRARKPLENIFEVI